MAFDPDAYLAQPAAEGFDPDAYLKGQGAPESSGFGGTLWRGAKNFASGVVTGTANLLGGAAALATKPFSSSLSKTIQGNVQQADSDFNSDIGADQGGGFMKGLGGAAPYLAAAVLAPEAEAPAAFANFSPALRTALSIGKSAGINGTVGAASSEGAGQNPLTGFLAGAGLGAGATAVGKLASSVIPTLASKLSAGATPEAYDLAASPGGFAKLEDATLVAPEKVKSLVNVANNPAPYMQGVENQVRGFENSAAPVDIRPILKAFDDAKLGATSAGGNTQVRNAANAALENEKNSVAGALAGPSSTSAPYQIQTKTPLGLNGFSEKIPAPQIRTQTNSIPFGPPSDVNGFTNYTIPASQLRVLKTSIGKGIPWDSPEAPDVKNALKGVYSAMDNALTGAVAKTQGSQAAAAYQSALDDWSQKIGDFQELQGRLGNVPSKQIAAANNLLKGDLEANPGNFDLLGRIDQQTGGDFLQHAKLRQQAAQLGMKPQFTVAPEDRSASLPWLPKTINLTKVGIPAVASEDGGLGAGTAAGILESPKASVLALKGANFLSRGNFVLPPAYQALMGKKKTPELVGQ